MQEPSQKTWHLASLYLQTNLPLLPVVFCPLISSIATEITIYQEKVMGEIPPPPVLCPPLFWAESKSFQSWDYCGLKATGLNIERCNSAVGI